jgi:8-oxo-dGTP pyrophosphatase MutT (NUDIX family)
VSIEPISPAIPAATQVIFRDVVVGPPELLILERAGTMAFAGGALVFPGGRVDPADHVYAARLATPDPDDTAARLAAIRETIEEAGLPVGLYPIPGAAETAAIRSALLGGTSLEAALADTGFTPDLAALTPFARWRPDHPGMRNYDTRFFLARLPADAPEASVDGTENVRLFWASAQDVLADAARGHGVLIYPTRRNLERLARFTDHDAAVADAHAHPVTTITPHFETRGGVPHLCIPEGLGYPITAEPVAAARRA